MNDSDTPASPGRRRVLRAAASAGGLAAAGCAAPDIVPGPPGPVPPPRVRRGDRWQYLEINLYNGEPTGEIACEAVEGGEPVRIRRTRMDGRPLDDEFYGRPWQVQIEPHYPLTISLLAPMPLLPDRLEAGARRHDSTRYTVAGGSATYWWDQVLTAPRWERVRVPAGDFDCLRVERLINFEHPDRARAFSRRNDVLWYAPSVNRWVQRQWTGSFINKDSLPRHGAEREDWVRWVLVRYAPAPVG